jgi:1-acyl-sn-glycerol-3-phosphate acyltransferase
MMISGPIVSNRLYRWRRQLFRFGAWNLLHRFWFKVHIAGWENIPADGPVIMMGNHVSALDPAIMISFYPDRDIIPLAKIEAFQQPLQRFFVDQWGAIPINRGEADLRALKSALEHLREGYVVMLYAEGHRSKSGLIQGQEGSAYLALKTNATIVPVAIWGTREALHGLVNEFKRSPVYIRFGRPFKFKNEGDRLPRESLRQMTDEAMYRIAELLPERWRGVYSDLTHATTNHLDFNISWDTVSEQVPQWAISTNWLPS